MWLNRLGKRVYGQQAACRNAKRNAKLAAQRRRYLNWLVRTFPGTVIKDRNAVSPYRYGVKTIAAGALSRQVWSRLGVMYSFVKQ